MKHFALIMALSFVTTSLCSAQSISKQVIGNSGLSMHNGAHIINFTVGECIVGNIENGAALFQGFWADTNSGQTLGNDEINRPFVTMSVYPNPVIDKLYLSSNDGSLSDHSYELYNLNGKRVFASANAQENSNTQEIDLSNLPISTYLLVVKNKLVNETKTFKIIKN